MTDKSREAAQFYWFLQTHGIYVSGSNVNIDANRMSAAENLEFFIGNKRFINGIEKNREEYKISQYADDKPLFTNGSTKSLDGILRN